MKDMTEIPASEVSTKPSASELLRWFLSWVDVSRPDAISALVDQAFELAWRAEQLGVTQMTSEEMEAFRFKWSEWRRKTVHKEETQP